MQLTRRHLMILGGAWSLTMFGLDRNAAAAEPRSLPHSGFGPLIKDPKGLLDLPAGFSYVVVSQAGAKMADGLQTPAAMDGMAAFAGPDDTVILVRNHELNPDAVGAGPFGANNADLSKVGDRIYDAGDGKTPSLGGTTTVVVNGTTGALVHEFLSLIGTNRNCAGGPTPWGSWITCEEDTATPGTNDKGITTSKRHGYAFEVPAKADVGLAEPIPLTAMGRFHREAVAIDPATGIVYQTEDNRQGVFYRFIPAEPGNLRAGGKLQALKIDGYSPNNTYNWDQRDIAVGQQFTCSWVDIADPDNNPAKEAVAKGCQMFTRSEGIWHGAGGIWFSCTDGGSQRKGQIWHYLPGTTAADGGKLTLFVEPDDGAVMENVDNLTVTPWGDLFGCEDNASRGASPENRLVHINQAGVPTVFAVNRESNSELAGACFSPDGKWCFLNLMYPGKTLAITGPWPT